MSKYRKKEIGRFADTFKALSNPHRLGIFLRLAGCCTPKRTCSSLDEMGACVGDLGKDLGIAPSTVSHHIKELQRAGLIRMQRRGQRVTCWVDPITLEGLSEFFGRASAS